MNNPKKHKFINASYWAGHIIMQFLYFSRAKLKAGERGRRRGVRTGGQVTGSLSSRHCPPGSAHRHPPPAQPQAEKVNVVFLQSASARSLIKVLQGGEVLQADLQSPCREEEKERLSPVILRRRTKEPQTSGSAASQTVLHHSSGDGGLQGRGQVTTSRKTRLLS